MKRGWAASSRLAPSPPAPPSPRAGAPAKPFPDRGRGTRFQRGGGSRESAASDGPRAAPLRRPRGHTRGRAPPRAGYQIPRPPRTRAPPPGPSPGRSEATGRCRTPTAAPFRPWLGPASVRPARSPPAPPPGARRRNGTAPRSRPPARSPRPAGSAAPRGFRPPRSPPGAARPSRPPPAPRGRPATTRQPATHEKPCNELICRGSGPQAPASAGLSR
jgi:hypothetical protein